MSYIDWWPPYHLEKMSPYYCMNCTPSKLFSNLHVSQYGRYGFEMKWERKVRGHSYYRQRYWKGKWKH